MNLFTRHFQTFDFMDTRGIISIMARIMAGEIEAGHAFLVILLLFFYYCYYHLILSRRNYYERPPLNPALISAHFRNKYEPVLSVFCLAIVVLEAIQSLGPFSL